MKLCRVQVSENQILSIACGANNQQPGDKVATALIGAKLPGGLTIKERKIRGEPSQGMLAAAEELGLPPSSEGILILPKSFPVGQKLGELLDSACLDLAIPPNRPDLLSHIGLARELFGIFNKKPHPALWEKSLKKGLNHVFKRMESPAPSPQLTSPPRPLEVIVKEPEMCPFYSGRILTHVKIGPSPPWLKARLEFLGINSINNIVDITNWILLEWGQPLHAFDLDKIEGNIYVEKAQSKSYMTDLRDQKLSFFGDELIIKDDKKPLALAGIIGGKDSAISETTTHIFIEAAVFAPYAVRRFSKRLGLTTDSSFRFSRSVQAHTTVHALQRACHLIQAVAGGNIVKKGFQKGRPTSVKNTISISSQQLSERWGGEVCLAEFAAWMKRMNCQVKKRRTLVQVEPPRYRTDLKIKEDLIEEWARLKGYESIVEVLPHPPSQSRLHNPQLDFLNRTQSSAKEHGFYQAINYSFMGEHFLKNFLGEHLVLGETVDPPLITNPVSQDLNALRPSLLPGLFKNLLLNVRHGQSCGRLFEMGVRFFKKNSGYEEKQGLAFMLWGKTQIFGKKVL